MAGNPHDPRRETTHLGKDLAWHGAMVLRNPLCAEFGIRSPLQLESFLRNDLPEFSLVREDSGDGVRGREEGEGGRQSSHLLFGAGFTSYQRNDRTQDTLEQGR